MSAAGGIKHTTNALGLVLATTLMLLCTNTSAAALSRGIPGEIRIPIYVMIIASVVSTVQMLICAYAFVRYQALGIFIPLIVTDCIVIGRAEAYAPQRPTSLVALGSFAIGLGSTCALLQLAALRELLDKGTLFDGAVQLLGGWVYVLRLEVFYTNTPFLLVMLPPSVFIGLGFMLAEKYLINQRIKTRQLKTIRPVVLHQGQPLADE